MTVKRKAQSSGRKWITYFVYYIHYSHAQGHMSLGPSYAKIPVKHRVKACRQIEKTKAAAESKHASKPLFCFIVFLISGLIRGRGRHKLLVGKN